MDQRAKMACAVKFFSQVGANFFKYAFEGKKDKESYFNAFVKTNIYTGGYIGKQASKVFDFPALGAWQISSGTLPEITAPFPQPAVNGVSFDVGTVRNPAITTVSGLTTALISSDSSRWREGDILTCLCYCATNYSNLPTIYTDQENRALTSVWQIRLSSSDTSALPSLSFPTLEIDFDCQLDSNGLSFVGSSGTEYTNNLYCFGLIHSRRTPNGLKVSSSTMVAPQSPELLWLVSNPSGSYYNAVIADWQASEEAILQGGLSASTQDTLIGWSDDIHGTFNHQPADVTALTAEPFDGSVYVKFISADAAAAGVASINAVGANGGTVSITKSVSGNIVTVNYTATLSQASSTAQVRVGTEVCVGMRRVS